MTLNQLKTKRQLILAIANKHGAKNVRVFGSVARDEAGPKSDIDFLVDVGKQHSAFFPGGLITELEQLLDYKVDVVEPSALHWYIQKQILSEAIPL